jgi:hypothetical protein
MANGICFLVAQLVSVFHFFLFKFKVTYTGVRGSIPLSSATWQEVHGL